MSEPIIIGGAFQQTFGFWVKERRLESGLRREAVAVGLDLSLETYKRIENGKRELTLSEAMQLCRLLGIDVATLLSLVHQADRVASRPDKRPDSSVVVSLVAARARRSLHPAAAHRAQLHRAQAGISDIPAWEVGA